MKFLTDLCTITWITGVHSLSFRLFHFNNTEILGPQRPTEQQYLEPMSFTVLLYQ